jgi:single-strand DNA-binding protein
MNNLNSILIEGNLVSDPVIATLNNGSSICRFSIASNRYYKNSENERMEEVNFIDVDTWGNLAEACNAYLSKGRKVRVVGRLKHDRWEDDDNQKKENYVIVAEHVEFYPPKKEKEKDK